MSGEDPDRLSPTKPYRSTTGEQKIDQETSETIFHPTQDWSDQRSDRENAIIWPAVSLLWLNRSSSNIVEMAKLYALHSREEILHLDWDDMGLTRSEAQLTIAAVESFYTILSEEDLTRDEIREELQLIEQYLRFQEKVSDAVKPFREAVDKFHLMSAISPNEGEEVDKQYLRRIADGLSLSDKGDILNEVPDELKNPAAGAMQIDQDDDSASDIIYKTLLYEVEGTYLNILNVEGDYVNTGVYKALEHIADEYTVIDDDYNRHDGRMVAEAVASATLNIPQPFRPLSKTADNPHLDVNDVSVNVEDFDDWRTDIRVEVGDHPLINDQLRSLDEEKVSLKEKDEEYNWVESVFLRMYDKLEEIQSDRKHPAKMDKEELETELVARVFDIDIENETTIMDHEIPLLDMPSQSSTIAEDEEQVDTLEIEGDLLAKTLFASFQGKGSFGGVIYDRDGEMKYMINKYILSEKSVGEFKNYPQMWERYATGFLLIQKLTHVVYSWNRIYDKCEEGIVQASVGVEPDIKLYGDIRFFDTEYETPEGNGTERKLPEVNIIDYLESESGMERAEIIEMIKGIDQSSEYRGEFFVKLLVSYFGRLDTVPNQCPLCSFANGEYCGQDHCKYQAELNVLDERFDLILISWIGRLRQDSTYERVIEHFSRFR
jgi:hypothetical protein